MVKYSLFARPVCSDFQNYWYNIDKSFELFTEIMLLYITSTKKRKGYRKEYFFLIIINNFCGQDNVTLTELCVECDWKILIITYNVTDKLKPIDSS